MSRLIKNIEGYDNYKITNAGEVISIKRNKEIILSSRINKGGYYYVNLCKNGKYKSKAIHKLVANAFIDNPLKLNVVNHIDGDKLNNNSSNLEFCTMSQNSKHAVEFGLIITKKGEDCSWAKLSESDVISIRERYSKSEISYSKLAKEYNVSKSTILQIINKKIWKHI